MRQIVRSSFVGIGQARDQLAFVSNRSRGVLEHRQPIPELEHERPPFAASALGSWYLEGQNNLVKVLPAILRLPSHALVFWRASAGFTQSPVLCRLQHQGCCAGVWLQ